MKNRKIENIHNACYPRSGHKLLRTSLEKYFEDRIKTSSVYIDNPNGSFTEIDTNYIKDHDFELKSENKPEYKYIIQYRHPLESIVSLYIKTRLDNETNPDTKEIWSTFSKNKLKYWVNFINKWVINNNHPNTLHVEYSELVLYPEKTLPKVIKFIDPENQPDMKKIHTIIKEQNINFKNNIRNFKYYDPEYFSELEKTILKELEYLNIKRKYD